MKKRLLTTILAVAVALTVFVPTYAFSAVDDIESVSHAKAVNTLGRLGVLNDDFEENEDITFGEFLGLAMELTGVGDIPSSSQSPFSDVSATDKYFNAVCAAKNMGIVSGWGDGTLGYNDTITSGRASKILVSILGYEPHAIAKGGYPAGYTIVAGNIGVFDELALDANSPLTWDQAAQMVYNCLEIEILQPESYPTESYVTVDGENPLTKWMKIKRVEGVVTANSLTTINGGEGEEEGYVTIDGVRFAENGTMASSYIGCKVNAYYREITSAKLELLEVSLDAEAKIWEISGEDIDEAATTASKIYYYEDNSSKAEDVSIEDGAFISYNFKKYEGAPSAELFTPENGAVTLIDSDGNKKADCVYIKNSTTYVVEEVRASNGYIKDLYNQPDLRLDVESNNELVYVITKDGVSVGIDTIAVNDVLTVTQSEDGNYVEIEIGYKRAKGILSEIGKNHIVINDRKYNVLRQNAAEFDEALLGKEIIALYDKYINASGYILSLTDDLSYGYLYDARSGGTGLDAGKKANLKIYTTSGEYLSALVADKVKLNGKTKDSSGNEYTGASLVAEFTDNGFIKHQLIRYKLNDEGKICEIETARQNCADFGGTGMDEDGFTIDLDYDNASSPVPHNFIYKNSGLLGSDYDLKSTIGIQVPNSEIWNGYRDGTYTISDLEKTFSMYLPYETWANDTRFPAQSPTIRLYDVDESKAAKVIVTEGSGGGGAVPKAHLMLVEDVVEAMDEDYNKGMMIKGIYKNEYVGFFVKEDEASFTEGELVYDATPAKPSSGDEIYGDPTLLDLNPGDVIKIALDATNKITNIFKVYSLEDQGEWQWTNQIEKGTSKIEINTVWKHRKYLMGGSEFSEWTNQNGDTGMYNQVRFYNYCFWTGNSHQMIHARALYPMGERLVVDLGPIEDSGNSPALKLGNVGKDTNYAFFDEATGSVRVATKDDFVKDDRYTYIIGNRYGVFNDIIVIKHEEPVYGYWRGYTEGK